MTVRAAGILFIESNKGLFLKRSNQGDHIGEWCFPGGKLEGDETPEQAAVRECGEEIGMCPEGARHALTRTVTSADFSVMAPVEEVDFTTFAQKVNDRFTPVLADDEHDAYAWADLNNPPQPLHPGCAAALKRLHGNELDVAELIAYSGLVSPQKYENMWLVAMRMTGTGAAYRRKDEEYIWRDPKLYLNDRFIKRCQGVPVIWQHPPKNILNSQEYGDRVIGAVMFAYIVSDEVWCIARINDEEAVEAMVADQLSTSPAVFFRNPAVNTKITSDDGNKILIEGDPSLLDHLAVCSKGVWDKGGDPEGIAEALAVGDSVMTEDEEKAAKAAADKAKADAEEKEREEKAAAEAKADADAGEKLDKVLACMDDFGKGLAALKADNDALKTRMDAIEDKEKEDPEKVAADKAKADAEEKGRKEAEEKAAADKAKADSDAIATHPAVVAATKEVADLKARMPRAYTDEEYTQLADAQAKADSVYMGHGKHAPRPLDGETVGGYKRRLAKGMQHFSTQWKDIDLIDINDKAFAVAETTIYADADMASRSPPDIGPGKMRMRTNVDEETGRRVNEFHGDPASWMGQFGGRRRLVKKISNAPHRY